MRNSIANALNVTPVVITTKDDRQLPEIPVIQLTGEKQEAVNIIDEAKKSIFEVIKTGEGALETAAEIAVQSQGAKDLEVVAKLMDSVVNANKVLVDISKRKVDMHKQEANTASGPIANNIFVGSTADLYKMLQKMDEDGTA